jgi:hypothetical protein
MIDHSPESALGFAKLFAQFRADPSSLATFSAKLCAAAELAEVVKNKAVAARPNILIKLTPLFERDFTNRSFVVQLVAGQPLACPFGVIRFQC